MDSLDPRVGRLGIKPKESELTKDNLDQLETYEVFLQLKENKPHTHGGVVHASNEDMALLFAKEQFSRRYTCTGMFVVRTQNVYATVFTEDKQSVYDRVGDEPNFTGRKERYEIFHLMKRGKQHIHTGEVDACDHSDAVLAAKQLLNTEKTVFNVWVVKTADILFFDEEDRDIWFTLPEKKFRDAIAYKAGDKIKQFKEEQALANPS